MDKQRILIVDDDGNIRHLLRLYVEKEGFEAEEADNGDRALEAFLRRPPALVLLDVMLPGKDGMEVLREIRRSGYVPVIMLTAKDETFDKVLGLELGADDYITKPFDPKELMARIKAVIRRTQLPAEQSNRLTFPNLVVDLGCYEVLYRGERLEMPPRELELLYYLGSHPGKVFTRDQLLEHVWGYDYDGDSRTVDVHIKRLRDKFAFGDESWQLRTVWGVGYKFEVGS